MKKLFIFIMALCTTGVLVAQTDTAQGLDLNKGKKASYHAFIHAGIGCYYMDNGESNIKGPEAIDGIYGITVINGAQIGSRFYIGVGLGFESLMTARGKDSRNKADIDYKEGQNLYYGFPVFIDAKWYLRKMTHIVTPYLMMDIGYESWRNDKEGKYKNDPAKLWQNCFYFNGGFGLHIGRYADVSWTAGIRDVQFRVGVEL